VTTRRVFFALWPDAALRAQLAAAAQTLGSALRGRAVPAHNLHLTLRFLGSLPPERLADACAAADTVRAAPLDFTLDQFGLWDGPRVAWLGSRAAAPGLETLAAALNAALGKAGFAAETRRFRPHVTLWRDARAQRRFPSAPALAWQADEFVLVESRPGRPYGIIQQWAL